MVAALMLAGRTNLAAVFNYAVGKVEPLGFGEELHQVLLYLVGCGFPGKTQFN